MNRKHAASVLAVLLYAQGLLGFAGVAAVLIKHQWQAGEFVSSASVADNFIGLA